MREFLFRSGLIRVQEIKIPVISVGNLSVGGTGKTSLVERISIYFKEMGFVPCIATRGYKRKRKGIFFVDGSEDKAKDVGDEPLLLARKTRVPVIVSKDRAEGIKRAIKEFGSNIAVLDDGFQLRNIKKDVEILILHEKNGSSYELFPKGPMRECVDRVKDGDIIIFKGKGVPEGIKTLLEGKPCFRLFYRPVHLFNLKRNYYLHYNILKGKRVLAFSGLGDNESFFEMLRSLGAKLIHTIPFGDHYFYRKRDIERLKKYRDVELIVTTEKDAVKLMDFDLPENLFYLSVEVRIEEEQEFFDTLKKLIEEKNVKEGPHI